MLPGPDAQRAKTHLLVLWAIWGGVLAGLVVIYLVLGRGPVKPGTTADLPIQLAGMAPLFVSIVVRWLALPRFSGFSRMLPIYVVGLANAEGCGILGIFLGGPYRDSLFLLGLLAVVSYVPFLLTRLLEPKPTGFIPNN
jgi:hypothetical protein